MEITKQQLEEAFKKTGAKPTTWGTIMCNDERLDVKACPIGVLWIEKFAGSHNRQELLDFFSNKRGSRVPQVDQCAKDLGFSNRQMCLIVQTWDRGNLDGFLLPTTPEEQALCEMILEVRKELLPIEEA